ncbi:uncharacterized protein N7483_006495 [Penicillium malachiteum]|uniref:uncharacterized protein n=1 Tax=Penicillium malachiteum TaxID=1324776 RepID=UPI002546A259|nr:uncharacterized protein N7483_006495 [Penicillium malachiteum]KAJ5725138.1 hypothetical protein N7483_006495 [Penicillium malachiteum]
MDVDIPPALEFCQDEDESDEAFEELINLAFIKRDPTNDTMSIHRLVQAEYKSQLSPEKFQEAFDAAALLLYEAFPKQLKGELFGDRMPTCTKFILHVYSLRDNSNIMWSEGDGKGLIPSVEYVKLMTNAAWYCAERQGHHDLEATLDNSFTAMKSNGMKETHPLLWAHLCNSAGRLWTQRGEFQMGERYMQECLSIRERELQPGDENIAGVLSNLGKLNVSMAHYEQAVEYQTRALNSGVIDGLNIISTRAQAVIMTNTGRALTELGRTTEALEWFKKSESIYPSSRNSPL